MADQLLIPEFPELPETLRQAALRGKLIPFIGAGASMLAGCPSWTKLADDAFNCFLDREQFTHAQMDQIKSLNPRVRLSIARGLQAKHEVGINFQQILHPKDWSNHEKGNRMYAALSRLGSTFVTTNYDAWLDDKRAAPVSTVQEGTARADTLSRPRRVIYSKSEFTAANLNQPDTVIHLHGSVQNPEGMVVTTADYIEHYQAERRGDQENPVVTFLRYLFQNKFVLFIGYGLDELEILDYVVLKSKESQIEPGSSLLEPRHFILQGFFSHERALETNLRDYYQQCGIGLISYLKDRRGWDQLLEVIEAFATRAPASPLMAGDEFLKWLNC